MELVCAMFVLRPWRPGDEASLVKHAGNRRIWINMPDRFPHPYTAADAAEWLHRVEEQGEPPFSFAIVLEGEPVGGVGLNKLEDVHRKVAEIGYWLSEDHWGRGSRPRRSSG